MASDGPPDAEPRAVAFSPVDLSTAVFDNTPSVLVPFPYPNEDAIRAALARDFELITWPEREIVSTSHVFLEGAPEDRDPLRVLLVPSTPLADRWYALRGGRASDVAIAGAVEDRDGRWVARFRVGQQPIVQIARATVDDAGNPEIRITYSERVRSEHDDLWHVEVDGSTTTCRLVNADDLVSEHGTTVVRLSCPRVPDEAHVRLRPGRPVSTVVGGYAAVDADGGEQRTIEFRVQLPSTAATHAPAHPSRLGSPPPMVREVARAASRFGLDG